MLGVEGNGVGLVGDIEIGNDTEDALLLLGFQLFLSEFDGRELDVYLSDIRGDGENDVRAASNSVLR